MTTDSRSRFPVDGIGTLTALVFGGLVALTALAYPLVPQRMTVHWSLGGPYYGPETLPKAAGLLVVPLLAVLVVGALVALARSGVVPEEPAASRPYRLSILGVTATFALLQVALVAANAGWF